ncbi:MAG: ferredoxin [Thermodesulfobacteriota bacterium]|nr:ferredoxin [Thermodesulfobacteriota bacterium]
MKTDMASVIPVIDFECCILCNVCVELASQVFHLNDAGYIETAVLDDYSDENINEAVQNCPRNCISWE